MTKLETGLIAVLAFIVGILCASLFIPQSEVLAVAPAVECPAVMCPAVECPACVCEYECPACNSCCGDYEVCASEIVSDTVQEELPDEEHTPNLPDTNDDNDELPDRPTDDTPTDDTPVEPIPTPKAKGNNGLGNGVDGPPPGIAKQGKDENDAKPTSPGNPDYKGKGSNGGNDNSNKNSNNGKKDK